MKKYLLVPFCSVLLYSAQSFVTSDAEARRGCCSHHQGVCGCSCCDGTPLSDKCAPYYPSCSNPAAQPARPTTRPVTRETSRPKPQAKAKGSFFNCSVINVHDGDTLTCSDKTKIRLTGIDAPELKQPYGNDAKLFAQGLVQGKVLKIKVVDIDRYQRIVGDVAYPDSSGQTKNLGYEITRAGYAWFYGQYSKDKNLPVLEQRARQEKAGLWADLSPVAPWDYRKSTRVPG